MDKLVVRPMSEADVVAVAELTAELGYPSEPKQLTARLRQISKEDLLLVAVTSDDVPLAFIQANRSCVIEVGFQVEIVGLVVSSRIRRGGVGRRLIEEVERWAASIDAERVVVRSNIQRSDSHEFYPAMSYEKVKTQAVYEKRLSRLKAR